LVASRCRHANGGEKDPEAEGLKPVHLRIEGRYEDAFLYMGRLILVTTSGSILMLPLSRLVNHAATRSTRELFRVLFEHNDRMTVRGLVRATGSAGAANSELRALAQQSLPATADPEAEFAVSSGYFAPLDLLVYYRRLYFATDQGLFTQDVDFDERRAIPVGKASRRTEPACLSVSARYGTINASCEDSGLYQSIDEFGWLGHRSESRMTKAADRSRRTSWLRIGFVNYVSNTSIRLFETKTERVSEKPTDTETDESPRVVISGAVRTNSNWLNQLARLGVSRHDIQHVWSSLRGLFVQSSKGLYFLGIADEQDEDWSVVSLGPGFTAVTWAGTFGRGMVVETEREVIAFERNQRLSIQTEAVIATRTFPNSIRYRRIVATVVEEAVVLTSVLNDYMLNIES
jgi:hypothetical protein